MPIWIVIPLILFLLVVLGRMIDAAVDPLIREIREQGVYIAAELGKIRDALEDRSRHY